ncbi:transcription termination factor MTEF1, chloroplastic-like [Solanum verrucosum]|uniref:transcription termination factor MTEF1, chloroplastic-like n=1 Tax=Solanum verrucosum TaxID=315347 RepID=UPI0020D0DE6D|nr:transcription termination factor MTEF1, chloroplastic-like [Solanum verrucosum]
MCPEILTAPISTTLRAAVTFLLREVHVTGENLPGVLRRRPRLLTKCVDKHLRPTLYFLQSSIGIEDVSKCASLLSCSVETKFIPRLDYFQRIGFSRRDAKVMFRRFPSLFCYSIEENLEPKFDYFVVEMGREMMELNVFPQYFSFSLEKRIKPRHMMCVEKGVCLSLPVMLKSHESRFRDRLEVCCCSSMPVRQSPFWYCTKFDHNVT